MNPHSLKGRLGVFLAGVVVLPALFALSPRAQAQGCVAVRCNSLNLVTGAGQSYLDKGDWQVSVAYRWLYSDRHFVDDSEQEQRQDEGTEVINAVHTVDLTATYAFTKQFSLSLTLPFTTARRSSLYEHDRINRHTTSAQGLGDVRLLGSMWLFAPDTHTNGNIAVGLGLKFPTGDFKAADIRHRTTGPELAYVDNSIQPGDGGWGLIAEFQAYQKIFPRTFAYVNATYLFQPQTENEIGTSIWDSYVGRIGVSYAAFPKQGVSVSLGYRVEGVPPVDAFGDSEGRRRPGYAMYVEPGVTWAYKRLIWNVSVPVAVYRYRQHNFAGRPGDAAFADYLVLTSISYRF